MASTGTNGAAVTVTTKVLVNFRTPAPARDWLDEVAEEHRVDRSDVIRAGLALARKHKKELDEMIELRR